MSQYLHYFRLTGGCCRKSKWTQRYQSLGIETKIPEVYESLETFKGKPDIQPMVRIILTGTANLGFKPKDKSLQKRSLVSYLHPIGCSLSNANSVTLHYLIETKW